MKLLIGYGSTLHSDDSFGAIVAEKLQASSVPSAALEILSVLQLTPELAEPISRASAVVFVDISTLIKAGEFTCISLKPRGSQIENSHKSNSLSHHMSPDLLLELATVLYGKTPPAWLYLAGAANLSLGESLSPELADIIPQVLSSIKRLLSEGKT